MRSSTFLLLLCVPLVVAAACASSEDTALPGGDGADAGATRDSGGGREGGTSNNGGGDEDDAGGERDDGGSTTDASTGTCSFNTQFQSNGETCVGFGVSSECEQAGCGRFGYLCIGGGPPGFSGCSEKSTSAFGNSYCCPTNECVAQPDQDDACSDAPGGLTKRYQCPPNGAGGHVAPPAGCVEHGSGETELEKMYCCP